jgi:Fur family ferric uptake transcriptional regulator
MADMSKRSAATSDPEAATTLEGAVQLVRDKGGRITPSRRLLLQVLFASPEHRSADDLAAEVQAQAPDIHLSTIYRNLEELEKLGVVAHTHSGHGPATYHRAKAVHGHFVCGECGKLIEAPQALFEKLASEAKAKFGFTIEPHHFAVLGRCADCS